MAKDKDYISMIHTSAWLRLRKSVLTKHPICQNCIASGLLTPATEVHHINPVEDALTKAEKRRLMFNINNLRALCHDCHVKAHIELGRSGKVATCKRTAKHVEEFVKKYF